MKLPKNIPPIVHKNDLWAPFLVSVWRDTEKQWDIQLEFARDLRQIRDMQRDRSPNLAAYDPDRSNSLTMYGLVARRAPRNRVLMTYSSAMFSMGDLDLRQYLETVGLASDTAGEFRILPDSRAACLATGIIGQFAFPGNAWTPEDFRGSKDWTRSLIMRFGILTRAINHGCFHCPHNVSFMRDRHKKAGLASAYQMQVDGVIYNHDPNDRVWMNYSGTMHAESLIQDLAA
ncbi:MAG: hypothetical protein O2985_17520 [Proteobacteria bacterium]|nr:hypothetical protein [Pseudomonadota bacterium]